MSILRRVLTGLFYVVLVVQVVLVILTAAVLVARMLPPRTQSEHWLSDLVAYWSAGQLLRTGHNPYDSAALYAIQQELGWTRDWAQAVWNPPWLLLLLYPLLVMPFDMARSVWLALSTLLLLGCAALTWRLLVRPRVSGSGLVAMLATLLFPPSLRMIVGGQVSVLMLLGLVGFLYFVADRRDLWAGASLALLTIKPHVTYLLWPVLLWWVITQRRWRVLGGLLGALACLGLLLLPMRPTWLLDYASIMRRLPDNLSSPVLGTVLRLLFGWDRQVLQYVPAGITSLVTLAVLIRRRATFAWRQAIGPLLLVSVPTAAYGWSVDQVVLLIPYLQLVGWLSQRRRTHGLAVSAIELGLSATSIILWLAWFGYGPRYDFGSVLRPDFVWLPGPLIWGGLYLVGWRTLGVSGSQAGPDELPSDRVTGRRIILSGGG